MAKYASKVVELAKSWIGKNEADGSFKAIIDIYNSHSPLARGYKVKYTDEWCATFVSAVAIKLGYTSIIPTECGCPQMIELFKKLGCWIENENRTPNAGDIIFYDWEDNGSGDNKGSANHVGIVEKVSNGTITVIEGNYSTKETVARRNIAVNGRYIRGYGIPKYDAEATTPKKAVEEDGLWGQATTRHTQRILGCSTIDGIVSNQLNKCKKYLPNMLSTSWEFMNIANGGSVTIKALQKLVGVEQDGYMGINTVKALQKFLKKQGLYKGAIDGVAGELTVIAWQKYINKKSA